MKLTEKIISILLCVLMMFSGAAAAFAADAGDVLPAPADNAVDMSVYVKTVLENQKVKPETAAKLLTAVGTFADVDGTIARLLRDKVLNGQAVIDVIGGLVETASAKMAEDPKLGSMADFVKYLFGNDYFIRGLEQDAKFAPAVEKLAKATEQKITTIVDVKNSEIKFTSADFGFEDGDAYGFADALVCMFSELLVQLNIRSALGDFTDTVKDGAYVVGNYNLFIPLYELLELDPISSVEFTKRVTASESADDKTRLRAAANLTLKPVADLLTRIEKEGLDAVIDVLPKLLYALDSGMVNDLVRNLLADKSLFFGMVKFNDLLEKLNLNTDLIWNVIDRKFVTGTQEEPAGFDFDKDGKKETTLPLTKAQFDALVKKLAFAADPSVRSSVSSTEKNRLALATDASLVKTILFDAVVEFLETEEGAAFAVKAVGSLVTNKVVQRLAEKFIAMFSSDFGRFILRIAQGLLADVALLAARIAPLFRKGAAAA